MPKLTRYLQKIFANNSNQVGVFGTGVDKETSKNVETLQSADYEEGWSSAIITNKNYPIWQEMDGVQYGLSYQLKYLFQNGIPEWLSTETYYTNNYCSYGGYIYQSLQDDNINHNPALNDGYWTVYSSVSDDRLHALKSYEDAGELLTDSEGLADVKNYAHSTFDLSKFTVVGSPTITDDGIYTGTSNAYLTSTISGLSSATKYAISLEYTPSRVDTWGWIIYPDNHIGLGLLQESGVIYLCDITNSTSFTKIANANLTLNAKTIFEITVDGTSYNFKATTNSVEQSSSGIFTNAFTSNILWVGNYPGNATDGYAKGSIDLKQFSITVDGVEVFSGNKTGIDTIKPDDYTVVGSPTISADGVASGFSSSNYLEASINFNRQDTVEGEFTTSSTINTNQTIFYGTNSASVSLFTFGLHSIGLVLWYGDNGTFVNIIPSVNLLPNHTYYFKIEKDKVTVDDYVASISIPSVAETKITFGKPTFSDSVPFEGSINLNVFKVYSNDNLVYQPCLKIPYTLSKTGSKIVDSVYRNRVSDMYNQFGYAPYYTLSDSDFTLPMGELYGMMLNQSTPHIVETYYNNGSGYILYSNKYCEQWGITAENTTITFLKPFADNKYIITALSYAVEGGANYVMYNTKTSTTMVLQVGADSFGDNLVDWRVCGYIA